MLIALNSFREFVRCGFDTRDVAGRIYGCTVRSEVLHDAASHPEYVGLDALSLRS